VDTYLHKVQSLLAENEALHNDLTYQDEVNSKLQSEVKRLTKEIIDHEETIDKYAEDQDKYIEEINELKRGSSASPPSERGSSNPDDRSVIKELEATVLALRNENDQLLLDVKDLEQEEEILKKKKHRTYL